MKKWLRDPGVQNFLGWLLSSYLRLILRTVRWRNENEACVEPWLSGAAGTGAIGLFWHGRIPLCLAVAPAWWRMRTRALVSPSADGEFIAQALARVGFPSIRISSAKKGDSAKMRAAVAAFRDAVNWVVEGGGLVVTPDGPRGPNEIIAAGSLQIARRSGAPIFLMGVAAHPAIQLDTWDKVMIGLPFGRGALVWDGPYYVPPHATEAEVEVLIADLSARLAAATRRAEAIVGRKPAVALSAPEPA